MDAGCGEGYYTGKLVKAFWDKGKTPVAAGVDISKIAVDQAAKAHKGPRFAVGSVFHLPVLPDSCDLG